MGIIVLYWSEIITVVSLISAILAWIAKIRWSYEYSAAKNAEIGAMKRELSAVENALKAQLDVKDEHIKLLENENSFLNVLTPEVLRKRVADANEGLLKIISEMDEDVEKLKTELKDKSDQIDGLRKVGEESSEKEKLLKAQVKELEDKVNSRETELERLESARLSKPEWEKLNTFINATGTFAVPAEYFKLLCSKETLNKEKLSDTFDKYRIVDKPIFKHTKGGDSIEKNNSSDDSNAK